MRKIFVIELSENQQKHIRARITSYFLREGYTAEEIGEAVDLAMDEKLSSVLPELEESETRAYIDMAYYGGRSYEEAEALAWAWNEARHELDALLYN